MSQEFIARRQFIAFVSALGLGAGPAESLWADASGGSPAAAGPGGGPALVAGSRPPGPITTEMLAVAEQVAGLEFTEAERALMLDGVNENLADIKSLRTVALANSVPPAWYFDPLSAGAQPAAESSVFQPTRAAVRRPAGADDLAFLPVTHLAELIRTRQVTSEELTRLYLDRLTRYGPTLECVITLTETRALRQARAADAEIAAGNYRGPLHGIPWGAKDLLAVAGYPTTWGAKPYQDQVLDTDAEVVRRLDQAGAVLVAKLTLGALAWGDVWFGGRTRNPWNLEQGSSGSSAGSAAATVAGLVGFAIGSETLGSIVSPSTRCGATGLRPTYGRVSRAGAMALSWTMDKLGPLCRSVEDCALVFNAIRGADQADPSTRDHPFGWEPMRGLQGLRIGYYRSAFEATKDHDTKPFDDAVLATLRRLGATLQPVEFPTDPPMDALGLILSVEAAAAFDELTRSNRDDLMVRQIANAWPNVFRQSRFIPAVEYVEANRARTLLMRATDAALKEVDVVVTPSFGGTQLLTTNLTGHPAVVVPSGFSKEGTPVSISFIGQLYGEGAVLRVARTYQEATGFHRRRPPGFGGAPATAG